MFRFITTRGFVVNLIVLIAVVLLLLFGTLQLLGFFTKHGQYLTVPNVMKMKTSDAIKTLEKAGFDVEIQDSVYTDTAKMGIVLKQLPDPNSTVKINRSVYLTVNRETLPLVEMPDLVSKSLNYALELINRNHLKLGDTTFKPDFAQGSVLEQQINGMKVLPNAKVKWGTKIDLVIAGGLPTREFAVPNLVGLTFGEAKIRLEQDGLILAAIIPDGAITDTTSAYVYMQNPPRFTQTGAAVTIKTGQFVDVWISQEMKMVQDTNVIIHKSPVPPPDAGNQPPPKNNDY